MHSLVLHGRKPIIELQKKCGNLSVSVKLLQNSSSFPNSFASASAANGSPRDFRNGKNFSVSYLVDTLGLTRKLAESVLRKVSFEEKGNPDSVLSLLRSHGFTDSQISSIITGYPRLLVSDAEKSLGPKLQSLLSLGASTSELTEIVSKVPKILGMKEDKTIRRYYDFIKEIIEADKGFTYERLCHSLSEGSQKENKIRNISVLIELGVPQRLLFSFLISNNSIVCGKERFEESLKKVVDMGFDPTSPRFVEALRIVYGYSEETIDEKFNVYKRLGLAEGDVWAMFKKWPISLIHSEKKITRNLETLKKCGLLKDEVLSVFKKYPQCIDVSVQNILNSIKTYLGLGFSRDEVATMVKRFPQGLSLSAELVKKKTEFLVKKMNWPLKDVALCPEVIAYSMEKRIVPRCNAIKALMCKGLIGSELPPMTSVLKSTDEVFLNRYAMKHGELVPELMAIFTMKEEKNR